MSQLQITPSPDGQSETQKVEVTVHSHEDNEEEEVMSEILVVSPSKLNHKLCRNIHKHVLPPPLSLSLRHTAISE